MAKQKTLKDVISFRGIGIHTGKEVTVVIKPAPVNTGIIYTRVDDPDKPSVKVSVDCAVETTGSGLRQTAIKCGSHEIKTIEHLMAVLHVFCVSNAYIDIDNEELPALDGSSLEYVKALQKVGLTEQTAELRCVEVKEPLVVDLGETTTVVAPSDKFQISYTLSYAHPDLFDQFVKFTIDEKTFAEEIAPSRTFCLKEEADYLQAKGFGKGATTQNTLVYKNNKPVDNELRFITEAARHKVIDLIGDLYLLGHPVRAHIITAKTGHTQNFQIAKKLSKLIQF